MAIPRVVIVGRPNVGKSTLFNRLLGRRRALVHDIAGVTRDRLEEKAEWVVGGKRISVLLVDTGGVGGDRFADEIEGQVKLALDEATVVILLFDGQSGLTPQDRDLIRKMTQSGVMERVPVLGVVNKVDVEKHEANASDFYSVGLEEILTISAEHGRGIDDLEKEVIARCGELDEIPETGDVDETPRIPKIAVIGRPNVGKSTLVNAILGENRMITSPIAGTTIDAVDSLVQLGGKPFLLIDTAGIRRKSKTEQGVEVLSVVQARKALERADVAILLLDGEAGISDQDEKIGGLIEEVGASVILALNKWDVQKSNPGFTREMAAERVRGKMAYLRYAPILFVSAKLHEGYEDLGDLIEEILHQRSLRIPTRELTDWVKKEAGIHNPMNAKFYLSHQTGRHPPTFVCHVSDPEKVHFSLRRHLSNALREKWGFMGSPVRMLFVKGSSAKRPLTAMERVRKRSEKWKGHTSLARRGRKGRTTR